MVQDNFFKKWVAVFVVVTQVVATFSGDVHAALPAPMPVTTKLSIRRASWSIPEKWGHVDFRQTGESGKTLILIEDAHAASDAQESILEILNLVQKRDKLQTILLEGLTLQPNLSIFQSFPDREWLDKTLRKIVANNDLAGGAASVMLASNSTHILQTEQKKLYFKTLREYLAALNDQPAIVKAIGQHKKKLGQLKKQTYTKTALEIDQLIELSMNVFEDEKNLQRLSPYLKNISSKQYPHLTQLRNIFGAEALTRRSVIRKEFVRTVLKLKQTAFSTESRKKLGQIEQQLLTGSASLLELSNQLFQIECGGASSHTVCQSGSWLNYLAQSYRLMNALRGQSVLEELEHLLNAELLRHLKTPKQIELNQKSVYFRFAQNLAEMKISRHEYERNAPQIKKLQLKSRWKHILEFYALQAKREQFFEVQITVALKKESAAVMVVGGFHRTGILNSAKKNGWSIVVVQPSLKKIPDEGLYAKLMQGQVGWRNHFQIQGGQIDLQAAFSNYLLEQLKKEKPEEAYWILRDWRRVFISQLADQKRMQDFSRSANFFHDGLTDLIPETPRDALRQNWINQLQRFSESLKTLRAENRLNSNSLNALLSQSSHAQILAQMPFAIVPSSLLLPVPPPQPRRLLPREQPTRLRRLYSEFGFRSEARRKRLVNWLGRKQTRPLAGLEATEDRLKEDRVFLRKLQKIMKPKVSGVRFQNGPIDEWSKQGKVGEWAIAFSHGVLTVSIDNQAVQERMHTKVQTLDEMILDRVRSNHALVKPKYFKPLKSDNANKNLDVGMRKETTKKSFGASIAISVATILGAIGLYWFVGIKWLKLSYNYFWVLIPMYRLVGDFVITMIRPDGRYTPGRFFWVIFGAGSAMIFNPLYLSWIKAHDIVGQSFGTKVWLDLFGASAITVVLPTLFFVGLYERVVLQTAHWKEAIQELIKPHVWQVVLGQKIRAHFGSKGLIRAHALFWTPISTLVYYIFSSMDSVMHICVLLNLLFAIPLALYTVSSDEDQAKNFHQIFVLFIKNMWIISLGIATLVLWQTGNWAQTGFLYGVFATTWGMVWIYSRTIGKVVDFYFSSKQIHLRRFKRLIKQLVKAVLYDIDGNLTAESGGAVTPEALDLILDNRLAGIPVMLITGRIKKSMPGSHLWDIESTREAIDQLIQERGLSARRDEILKGLYFSTEGGYFIRNGFREDEVREDGSGFMAYDDWVAKKVGVERDLEWEKEIHQALNELSREKSWGLSGEKNVIYEFFVGGELHERVNQIQSEIEALLKEKNLMRSSVSFLQTENSVIVNFYPFDKSLGVDFMEDHFRHRKGNIIASGDNGQQKVGLDHAMLARKAGLASNRYSPDDPSEIIALPLIAPKELKPGVEMVIWAMRQFIALQPQGHSTSSAKKSSTFQAESARAEMRNLSPLFLNSLTQRGLLEISSRFDSASKLSKLTLPERKRLVKESSRIFRINPRLIEDYHVSEMITGMLYDGAVANFAFDALTKLLDVFESSRSVAAKKGYRELAEILARFLDSELRFNDDKFLNRSLKETGRLKSFHPVAVLRYSYYFLRNQNMIKQLKQISPAARINLKIEAYLLFVKGWRYPKIAESISGRIEEIKEREKKYAGLSTQGVEVEVWMYLENTYPRSSAEDFVKIFGINLGADGLIEFAPGPAVDWQDNADLIDHLQDLGLIPDTEGDSFSLHASMVSTNKHLPNSDKLEPGLNLIALAETYVTASDERIGDKLDSIIRIEAGAQLYGFESIGRQRPDESTRFEYRFGNVNARLKGKLNPDYEFSRSRKDSAHRKALRIVFYLHHALVAAHKTTNKNPNQILLAYIFGQFEKEFSGFLESIGVIDRLGDLESRNNSDDLRDRIFEKRTSANRVQAAAIIEKYTRAIEGVIGASLDKETSRGIGLRKTLQEHDLNGVMNALGENIAALLFPSIYIKKLRPRSFSPPPDDAVRNAISDPAQNLRAIGYELDNRMARFGHQPHWSLDDIAKLSISRMTLQDLPSPNGVNVGVLMPVQDGFEGLGLIASRNQVQGVNFLYFLPGKNLQVDSENHRVFIRYAAFINNAGELVLGEFDHPVELDLIVNTTFGSSQAFNQFASEHFLPLHHGISLLEMGENKFNFGRLMRDANLLVPDQRLVTNVEEALSFRHPYNSAQTWEELVMKPVSGSLGEDVHIFTREQRFTPSFKGMVEEMLLKQGPVLFGERIKSWPAFDKKGRRLDWNIRALVSWQKGKPVFKGDMAYVRYAPWSQNAVNLATGARPMKLRQFLEWQGMEPPQIERFIAGLSQTVHATARAIHSEINRKQTNREKLFFKSRPIIVGLDFIYNEHRKFYDLEANTSAVGGVGTLENMEKPGNRGEIVSIFLQSLKELAEKNLQLRGRLDSEMSQTGSLIEFDPLMHPDYVNDAAGLLYEANFLGRAKSAYQYLARHPEYSDRQTAFNYLIGSFYYSAHYPAALKLAQIFAAENPQEAQSWENLGYIYLMLGMAGLCASSFLAALRINPQSKDAIHGLKLAEEKFKTNRLVQFATRSKESTNKNRAEMRLLPNLDEDKERVRGFVRRMNAALENSDGADPDFLATWQGLLPRARKVLTKWADEATSGGPVSAELETLLKRFFNKKNGYDNLARAVRLPVVQVREMLPSLSDQERLVLEWCYGLGRLLLPDISHLLKAYPDHFSSRDQIFSTRTAAENKLRRAGQVNLPAPDRAVPSNGSNQHVFATTEAMNSSIALSLIESAQQDIQTGRVLWVLPAGPDAAGIFQELIRISKERKFNFENVALAVITDGDISDGRGFVQRNLLQPLEKNGATETPQIEYFAVSQLTSAKAERARFLKIVKAHPNSSKAVFGIAPDATLQGWPMSLVSALKDVRTIFLYSNGAMRQPATIIDSQGGIPAGELVQTTQGRCILLGNYLAIQLHPALFPNSKAPLPKKAQGRRVKTESAGPAAAPKIQSPTSVSLYRYEILAELESSRNQLQLVSRINEILQKNPNAVLFFPPHRGWSDFYRSLPSLVMRGLLLHATVILVPDSDKPQDPFHYFTNTVSTRYSAGKMPDLISAFGTYTRTGKPVVNIEAIDAKNVEPPLTPDVAVFGLGHDDQVLGLPSVSAHFLREAKRIYFLTFPDHVAEEINAGDLWQTQKYGWEFGLEALPVLRAFGSKATVIAEAGHLEQIQARMRLQRQMRRAPAGAAAMHPGHMYVEKPPLATDNTGSTPAEVGRPSVGKARSGTGSSLKLFIRDSLMPPPVTKLSPESGDPGSQLRTEMRKQMKYDSGSVRNEILSYERMVAAHLNAYEEGASRDYFDENPSVMNFIRLKGGSLYSEIRKYAINMPFRMAVDYFFPNVFRIVRFLSMWSFKKIRKKIGKAISHAEPDKKRIEGIVAHLRTQIKPLRKKEIRRVLKGYWHGYFLIDYAMQEFEGHPYEEADASRPDYISVREWDVMHAGRAFKSVLNWKKKSVEDDKDVLILNFLVGRLNDRDPWVAKAAISEIKNLAPYLSSLDQKNIAAQFANILKNKQGHHHEMVRGSAARNIRFFPDPEHVEVLMDVLAHDPNNWVQSYAAEALEYYVSIYGKRLGAQPYSGELVQLLLDKAKIDPKEDLRFNISLRVSAIRALSYLGWYHKDVSDLLKQLILTDVDSSVQEAALLGLGRMMLRFKDARGEWDAFLDLLIQYLEDQHAGRPNIYLKKFIAGLLIKYMRYASTAEKENAFKIKFKALAKNQNNFKINKLNQPNPIVLLVIDDLLPTSNNAQRQRGSESDKVFRLVKHFLDQGWSPLLVDRFRKSRFIAEVGDQFFIKQSDLDAEKLSFVLKRLTHSVPALFPARDKARAAQHRRATRIQVPIPGEPIVVMTRKQDLAAVQMILEQPAPVISPSAADVAAPSFFIDLYSDILRAAPRAEMRRQTLTNPPRQASIASRRGSRGPKVPSYAKVRPFEVFIHIPQKNQVPDWKTADDADYVLHIIDEKIKPAEDRIRQWVEKILPPAAVSDFFSFDTGDSFANVIPQAELMDNAVKAILNSGRQDGFIKVSLAIRLSEDGNPYLIYDVMNNGTEISPHAFEKLGMEPVHHALISGRDGGVGQGIYDVVWNTLKIIPDARIQFWSHPDGRWMGKKFRLTPDRDIVAEKFYPLITAQPDWFSTGFRFVFPLDLLSRIEDPEAAAFFEDFLHPTEQAELYEEVLSRQEMRNNPPQPRRFTRRSEPTRLRGEYRSQYSEWVRQHVQEPVTVLIEAGSLILPAAWFVAESIWNLQDWVIYFPPSGAPQIFPLDIQENLNVGMAGFFDGIRWNRSESSSGVSFGHAFLAHASRASHSLGLAKTPEDGLSGSMLYMLGKRSILNPPFINDEKPVSLVPVTDAKGQFHLEIARADPLAARQEMRSNLFDEALEAVKSKITALENQHALKNKMRQESGPRNMVWAILLVVPALVSTVVTRPGLFFWSFAASSLLLGLLGLTQLMRSILPGIFGESDFRKLSQAGKLIEAITTENHSPKKVFRKIRRLAGLFESFQSSKKPPIREIRLAGYNVIQQYLSTEKNIPNRKVKDLTQQIKAFNRKHGAVKIESFDDGRSILVKKNPTDSVPGFTTEPISNVVDFIPEYAKVSRWWMLVGLAVGGVLGFFIAEIFSWSLLLGITSGAAIAGAFLYWVEKSLTGIYFRQAVDHGETYLHLNLVKNDLQVIKPESLPLAVKAQFLNSLRSPMRAESRKKVIFAFGFQSPYQSIDELKLAAARPLRINSKTLPGNYVIWAWMQIFLKQMQIDEITTWRRLIETLKQKLLQDGIGKGDWAAYETTLRFLFTRDGKLAETFDHQIVNDAILKLQERKLENLGVPLFSHEIKATEVHNDAPSAFNRFKDYVEFELRIKLNPSEKKWWESAQAEFYQTARSDTLTAWSQSSTDSYSDFMQTFNFSQNSVTGFRRLSYPIEDMESSYLARLIAVPTVLKDGKRALIVTEKFGSEPFQNLDSENTGTRGLENNLANYYRGWSLILSHRLEEFALHEGYEWIIWPTEAQVEQWGRSDGTIDNPGDMSIFYEQIPGKLGYSENPLVEEVNLNISDSTLIPPQPPQSYSSTAYFGKNISVDHFRAKNLSYLRPPLTARSIGRQEMRAKSKDGFFVPDILDRENPIDLSIYRAEDAAPLIKPYDKYQYLKPVYADVEDFLKARDVTPEAANSIINSPNQSIVIGIPTADVSGKVWARIEYFKKVLLAMQILHEKYRDWPIELVININGLGQDEYLKAALAFQKENSTSDVPITVMHMPLGGWMKGDPFSGKTNPVNAIVEYARDNKKATILGLIDDDVQFGPNNILSNVEFLIEKAQQMQSPVLTGSQWRLGKFESKLSQWLLPRILSKMSWKLNHWLWPKREGGPHSIRGTSMFQFLFAVPPLPPFPINEDLYLILYYKKRASLENLTQNRRDRIWANLSEPIIWKVNEGLRSALGQHRRWQLGDEWVFSLLGGKQRANKDLIPMNDSWQDALFKAPMDFIIRRLFIHGWVALEILVRQFLGRPLMTTRWARTISGKTKAGTDDDQAGRSEVSTGTQPSRRVEMRTKIAEFFARHFVPQHQRNSFVDRHRLVRRLSRGAGLPPKETAYNVVAFDFVRLIVNQSMKDLLQGLRGDQTTFLNRIQPDLVMRKIKADLHSGKHVPILKYLEWKKIPPQFFEFANSTFNEIFLGAMLMPLEVTQEVINEVASEYSAYFKFLAREIKPEQLAKYDEVLKDYENKVLRPEMRKELITNYPPPTNAEGQQSRRSLVVIRQSNEALIRVALGLNPEPVTSAQVEQLSQTVSLEITPEMTVGLLRAYFSRETRDMQVVAEQRSAAKIEKSQSNGSSRWQAAIRTGKIQKTALVAFYSSEIDKPLIDLIQLTRKSFEILNQGPAEKHYRFAIVFATENERDQFVKAHGKIPGVKYYLHQTMGALKTDIFNSKTWGQHYAVFGMPQELQPQILGEMAWQRNLTSEISTLDAAFTVVPDAMIYLSRTPTADISLASLERALAAWSEYLSLKTGSGIHILKSILTLFSAAQKAFTLSA